MLDCSHTLDHQGRHTQPDVPKTSSPHQLLLCNEEVHHSPPSCFWVISIEYSQIHLITENSLTCILNRTIHQYIDCREVYIYKVFDLDLSAWDTMLVIKMLMPWMEQECSKISLRSSQGRQSSQVKLEPSYRLLESDQFKSQ